MYGSVLPQKVDMTEPLTPTPPASSRPPLRCCVRALSGAADGFRLTARFGLADRVGVRAFTVAHFGYP